MRHLSILSALCLLTGYPGTQADGQATRALLTFGGPADDPAIELLDVTTALRRPDGRMVVVNGKPLEVRLYNGRGRFIRAIGSPGDGPGQYRGGVLLQPWPGDSIAVFSTGSRRWLLYRLDGTLVREWPHGDGPIGGSWVTLRGATLTRTGVMGEAGCAVTLVEAHPARGRPGEAFTDAGGRLWRHDLDDLRWEVRDARGSVLGTRLLPAGFRPVQFIADTIVGIHPDSDGFPLVSVIPAGLGALPTPPPPGCPPVTVPESRVGGAAIRTALRNAMTFGEAHRSRHGGYPTESGTLPDRMAPNGTEFRIIRATSDSWIVAVVESTTGYYCMYSLGPDGVPGMPSGVLHCGR